MRSAKASLGMDNLTVCVVETANKWMSCSDSSLEIETRNVDILEYFLNLYRIRLFLDELNSFP